MADSERPASRARVQVIRHLCFEDLGALAPLLARAGPGFEYLDPATEPLDGARDAEFLIVLGGPISVNDEDRFPFLAREVQILRYRIDNELPTLGICLGAQLIAKALGASVRPMPSVEIGWQPLTLTPAGRAGPLRHLQGVVLHWHGEMFELPPGCESLAASAQCPNQAFAVARHTLALQFHIEVSADLLERWLVGHIHELDHCGIPIRQLRDDASRYAAQATTEGARLCAEWLRSNGSAYV